LSGSTKTLAKRGWLRRHWGWLKWCCAAALLTLLFYRYRKQIAGLELNDIRWEFAAVAVLLCGGAVLLTFTRWFLLVWAQEFDFTYRDAVRLGFFGYILNFVGPGAVGGDLVKAVVLARRQESRRAVAVATVFLDRLLGLLALFLVGGGVWALQSEATRGGIFLTCAITFNTLGSVGLIGLFLLLHTPLLRARWLQWFRTVRVVGRLIGELLDGVALYQSRPRVVWLAVAISIAGHIATLSSFYFSAIALSPTAAVPDYFAHLLFMPAAELAGMVPVVPGGLGVLEVATARLYGLAGFTGGKGFLTAVGFRVTTILIAVLGIGYYFSARQDVREAQDVLQSESVAVSASGK
jgi:glycosyltransferase 2 family protein